MSRVYAISGDDFWVKIVGMLQQNWASIQHIDDGAVVYFIDNGSDVFDEIKFENTAEAIAALERNGFKRLREYPDLQASIDADPPRPPFTEGKHPSGKIYSSGKYWK